MIWITSDDIVGLHSQVIRMTGGLDGIRDSGVLDSAVNAPMQTFGGRDLFASEVEKIVRLGYGLASNHAFIDGNKRIGALVVQLLLKWNGYKLSLQEGELSDIFIAVADGTANETDLLLWVQRHLE